MIHGRSVRTPRRKQEVKSRINKRGGRLSKNSTVEARHVSVHQLRSAELHLHLPAAGVGSHWPQIRKGCKRCIRRHKMPTIMASYLADCPTTAAQDTAPDWRHGRGHPGSRSRWTSSAPSPQHENLRLSRKYRSSAALCPALLRHASPRCRVFLDGRVQLVDVVAWHSRSMKIHE